jgi:hypothetical protein
MTNFLLIPLIPLILLIQQSIKVKVLG